MTNKTPPQPPSAGPGFAVPDSISGDVEGGSTVPETISGDFVLRSLVRSVYGQRMAGAVTADEAFSWIAALAAIAVESAFMPGKRPPIDLNEFDDDEAERALDRFTANVMAVLGEEEMARLFIENRSEFDTRCEAGRRYVDMFGHGGSRGNGEVPEVALQ